MSKMWCRVLLISMVLSTVLFSCKRQTLEDPYFFIAHIPITTDWSESLLKSGDIANVSICAYPVDGGAPIVMLSDNIYFNVLELPIGEYHILVYNELLGDVKGLENSDATYFDQIRTHIKQMKEPAILYDTLRVNDIVAENHNIIAAWVMQDLTIDKAMVETTRSDEFSTYIKESKSKTKALMQSDTKADVDFIMPALPSKVPTIGDDTEVVTRALESLADVHPQSKNTILRFNIRVANLNNAMRVEALLRGTEYGAYLTTDRREEYDDKRVVYVNMVRNRVFDDPKNGIDGYMSLTVNTFGTGDVGDRYYIDLSCATNSGKVLKFRFDITDQIEEAKGSKDITINLGSVESPAITLPASSDVGFDVGDWDDEIIVDIN